MPNLSNIKNNTNDWPEKNNKPDKKVQKSSNRSNCRYLKFQIQDSIQL